MKDMSIVEQKPQAFEDFRQRCLFGLFEVAWNKGGYHIFTYLQGRHIKMTEGRDILNDSIYCEKSV